jgi:anaphase-promoting complex subunit 3
MHAAENPHVASQLRNLVYYSLDNELLSNALFHAGRLHGIDSRNGDASHLIALCHFRMGQYKAAYDYSRDKGIRGLHLGCSYIFAQACLALQRYAEGITALERSKGLWVSRNHWSMSDMSILASHGTDGDSVDKHSETSRRHIPDAPAVNYLLGKLWVSYGDSPKAVEYFAEALKLNPFLWDSFSELCSTGKSPCVQQLRKANIY